MLLYDIKAVVTFVLLQLFLCDKLFFWIQKDLLLLLKDSLDDEMRAFFAVV
jgi:hypothetical protein